MGSLLTARRSTRQPHISGLWLDHPGCGKKPDVAAKAEPRMSFRGVPKARTRNPERRDFPRWITGSPLRGAPGMTAFLSSPLTLHLAHPVQLHRGVDRFAPRRRHAELLA